MSRFNKEFKEQTVMKILNKIGLPLVFSLICVSFFGCASNNINLITGDPGEYSPGYFPEKANGEIVKVIDTHWLWENGEKMYQLSIKKESAFILTKTNIYKVNLLTGDLEDQISIFVSDDILRMEEDGSLRVKDIFVFNNELILVAEYLDDNEEFLYNFYSVNFDERTILEVHYFDPFKPLWSRLKGIEFDEIQNKLFMYYYGENDIVLNCVDYIGNSNWGILEPLSFQLSAVPNDSYDSGAEFYEMSVVDGALWVLRGVGIERFGDYVFLENYNTKTIDDNPEKVLFLGFFNRLYLPFNNDFAIRDGLVYYIDLFPKGVFLVIIEPY